MFLYNKKLLALSVAALSISLTACNKTNQNTDNTDTTYNNDVAVNNPDLSEVTDDDAPSDSEKIEINIGLIKNSASALGAAHLFANSEDNSAYENYTPVVYNTSDELLTAFQSGDINVAVLPPDKAALCYSNVNCYVTAITGGSNYYIAENGSTVSNISDLNGKTVTLSSEDTMSDSILNIIAKYNDININYNFVDTNKDIVDGLKSGSINLALLQEPYLSQTTQSNVRSAVDLYDYWNDAVGSELVSSCLIVNKNFVSEQSVAFQFFMKDYTAAASMARRNTEETAQNANKFALTDDINSSKAAIPGCGVTFKTGADMKSMLESFYNAIAENNADILGGQIPDENFYFVSK